LRASFADRAWPGQRLVTIGAILNRMSLSPDQRHVRLLADRTRDIDQITAVVARRILESRQLFAILKTCRIVSARWLGLVQPVSHLPWCIRGGGIQARCKHLICVGNTTLAFTFEMPQADSIPQSPNCLFKKVGTLSPTDKKAPPQGGPQRGLP
jgi:hypothetical protein